MSILSRLIASFQARANQIANSVEDPRASLDYSLLKLEEIRGQINRSLVEVSAARKRLEGQQAMLDAAAARHQQQARAAVSAGRDDLARVALQRREETESRRAELTASLENLDQQLDNLKESQAALERKIALFQSRKEELKAIYDASQAQLRIRESLSGISADLTNVGSTIQRAEARIREMQSRADAIEGLVAEGFLPDALEPGRDDIDRELARIGRQQAVEDELARLKGESQGLLTQDKNPPALEAGEQTSPPQPPSP